MNKMMESRGGNSSMLLRDYRKGNWTVQETMVLVEAKKMDEERRMKKHGETSEGGGGGGGRSKPTELRWKWVEDYCWRKGCFRSQNQCNDKWDNLLRYFKKVRDHERRRNRLGVDIGGGGDDDDQQRDVHGDIRSYWKLEKVERKEKGLPSNMPPEIYEALAEVVERKAQRTAEDVGASNPDLPRLVERSAASTVLPSLPPAVMQRHPHSVTVTTALPPPPQPPSLPPLPTDCDTSEGSDSSAKRRRRRRSSRKLGEGSSGGGGGGNAAEEEAVIGSAISRGASIIAEAIQEREEREERRHREVMRMEERRLEVEETNAENSRRIVHGVVEAINKLSNSIFALASNKHRTTSK